MRNEGVGGGALKSLKMIHKMDNTKTSILI